MTLSSLPGRICHNKKHTSINFNFNLFSTEHLTLSIPDKRNSHQLNNCPMPFQHSCSNYQIALVCVNIRLLEFVSRIQNIITSTLSIEVFLPTLFKTSSQVIS